MQRLHEHNQLKSRWNFRQSQGKDFKDQFLITHKGSPFERTEDLLRLVKINDVKQMATTCHLVKCHYFSVHPHLELGTGLLLESSLRPSHIAARTSDSLNLAP